MAREVIEVITPSTTDDLPEGSSNKYDTGAPPANLADLDSTASDKLAGIDANAKVDQTGLEMQSAIVGLSDSDRVLVGSEPLSGEMKIYGIHRNAAGNLELDSEDTPV